MNDENPTTEDGKPVEGSDDTKAQAVNEGAPEAETEAKPDDESGDDTEGQAWQVKV